MARPFRPRTRFGAKLTGFAFATLVRLLGKSFRLRPAAHDPFLGGLVAIGALWHRDALLAAWYFRDRGFAVSVSLSPEGNMVDEALRFMGYAPSARGSSTRGGQGLLRQLVAAVRAGRPVAILPDGPHGPPREAKPGVVALASLTGVPIVPVALAARPSVANRNWDGTCVPLPFAEIHCVFGEPLAVPRDVDPDTRQKALKELERRLDALRAEVDALAGLPPALPPAATGGP
jgi:lysophospholipid acyltransferase (LPLAT)-like uncharacterized protein